MVEARGIPIQRRGSGGDVDLASPVTYTTTVVDAGELVGVGDEAEVATLSSSRQCSALAKSKRLPNLGNLKAFIAHVLPPMPCTPLWRCLGRAAGYTSDDGVWGRRGTGLGMASGEAKANMGGPEELRRDNRASGSRGLPFRTCSLSFTGAVRLLLKHSHALGAAAHIVVRVSDWSNDPGRRTSRHSSSFSGSRWRGSPRRGRGPQQRRGGAGTMPVEIAGVSKSSGEWDLEEAQHRWPEGDGELIAGGSFETQE
ncbi:hypothetical protein E2562_011768 [Oryza meyeriana var. granulata]|uniref:Uncharacterized protein n=1 Tax=Oryza meyeriana var. granulata TaxID=110450 RepID=A0A6G1CP91_9ORYZ|nr:hypothetical protein E2562_011768 [Oryza meyeriana var. granulata]